MLKKGASFKPKQKEKLLMFEGAVQWPHWSKDEHPDIFWPNLLPTSQAHG